jgi:hypothetical protein
MKCGFGIEVACKATSRKLMCGASTEAEGPVSPENPVMSGDLEKKLIKVCCRAKCFR